MCIRDSVKSFGKVHPKYETPYFSILVQCAVAIVLIFASSLSDLLGYFTLVALLKNFLTFGTIIVLRNKEHYKPAYRMPARPLMVGIAMVITGTLIWSTFIWAPLAGIACAVIAVVKMCIRDRWIPASTFRSWEFRFP